MKTTREPNSLTLLEPQPRFGDKPREPQSRFGGKPREPQSRFGDKPLNFQVVCPQNGTAVLKGLTRFAFLERTKKMVHPKVRL